jgi:hypothetical protein
MGEARQTRRRRGNGQYVNVDRRVDPDEARQQKGNATRGWRLTTGPKQRDF